MNSPSALLETMETIAHQTAERIVTMRQKTRQSHSASREWQPFLPWSVVLGIDVAGFGEKRRWWHRIWRFLVGRHSTDAPKKYSLIHLGSPSRLSALWWKILRHRVCFLVAATCDERTGTVTSQTRIIIDGISYNIHRQEDEKNETEGH